MFRVVTASTARASLSRIIDQSARGSRFIVTYRGTPHAVILGISEFIKATGLTRDIALGLKDLDAGKSVSLDRKTLEGIKTRRRAKLTAIARKKRRS